MLGLLILCRRVCLTAQLAKASPSSCQQRFRSMLGDAQDLANRRRAEPLSVLEQQCLPLVLRQAIEQSLPLIDLELFIPFIVQRLLAARDAV